MSMSESEMRAQIKPLDIWRNNKHGRLYRVNGFVQHSETKELLVRYHSIVDPADDDWVRPIELFLNKFTLHRRSGYGKV